MADAPPEKTVEMNSMEQTVAIKELQRDVKALEQAVLLIVEAAGPLGNLRDMIADKKGR